MKKLTLLSAILLISAVVFGQWNEAEDAHFGCNHAKGQHHKGADAMFYFQEDLMWDYDVKF